MNDTMYHLNESPDDTQTLEWDSERRTTKELRDQLLPLVLCDALSYSISMLETKFRSYTKQKVKDKLPRALQLNNTVTSNLWRLFTIDYLQRKFGVRSNDNDSNDQKWFSVNFFSQKKKKKKGVTCDFSL
ncbi:hypothetical protein RFI_12618 [Reticulomyxa filosa]|uniref:Uncharacterized protein n=1 Tax=Reticulomyxa filosa TaxID=46433 RepID=X6NGP9_RETFI|nr:hypothetical protein RFI_12618 [Reticulomyxa filosa]|eukprot:ETO24537.1 hypothetical protein RFI_12618 [Reticulomyxa filosa]